MIISPDVEPGDIVVKRGGSPEAYIMTDARSYTVVDEHILGFNVMKGRKVITSGRIVVSADGKGRTVTMSGTDAKGHRVSSSEVYEKQ
jgi:hypothetical protein